MGEGRGLDTDREHVDPYRPVGDNEIDEFWAKNRSQ
jgi:hypothetical protein